MLKMKALTLFHTTYLVLDEADLMFDSGFEQQIRTIIGQIRPDRQVSLFTATFPRKIELLARDTLVDPLRIVIGKSGQASSDVTQFVHIMEQQDKWTWLVEHMEAFLLRGSVLVFVNNKQGCEELSSNLCTQKTLDMRSPFQAASIHGDKSQEEREDVINAFKKGYIPILVATDVAARGLDIASVRTVINFDMARDIDDHTHRIGRTGRAGDKNGIAYTLLTPQDGQLAPALVRNLESSEQFVPDDLMQLALDNPKFSTQRSGYKKKKPQQGDQALAGRWKRVHQISQQDMAPKYGSFINFVASAQKVEPTKKKYEIIPPKRPDAE